MLMNSFNLFLKVTKPLLVIEESNFRVGNVNVTAPSNGRLTQPHGVLGATPDFLAPWPKCSRTRFSRA